MSDLSHALGPGVYRAPKREDSGPTRGYYKAYIITNTMFADSSCSYGRVIQIDLETALVVISAPKLVGGSRHDHGSHGFMAP